MNKLECIKEVIYTFSNGFTRQQVYDKVKANEISATTHLIDILLDRLVEVEILVLSSGKYYFTKERSK